MIFTPSPFFKSFFSITWNSGHGQSTRASVINASSRVRRRHLVCANQCAAQKPRIVNILGAHAQNSADRKCGAPKVAVAPHIVALERAYFIARARSRSRGRIRSFFVFSTLPHTWQSCLRSRSARTSVHHCSLHDATFYSFFFFMSYLALSLFHLLKH